MKYIPVYKCKMCGAMASAKPVSMIDYGDLKHMIDALPKQSTHQHLDIYNRVVSEGISDLIVLNVVDSKKGG